MALVFPSSTSSSSSLSPSFFSTKLCFIFIFFFSSLFCASILMASSPVVVVGQDQSISLGRLSPSSSSPHGSPLLVEGDPLLDSDQRKSHSARQCPRLDAREEHRRLCINSCCERVSLSTDVVVLQSIPLCRFTKLWIFPLSILNRRGCVGDFAASFLPVLQWSFISILSPLSTVSSLRQFIVDLVESLCAPLLTTQIRVSSLAGIDASPQSQSLKLSVPLLSSSPEALDRRRSLRFEQIHGGGWGNTPNPNVLNVMFLGFAGPWFNFNDGFLVVFLGVDLGNNGLNYIVLFQFMLVRWAFSFFWVCVFDVFVTSLPTAHSSVIESLSLSYLFERANFPGRILLDQRLHTRPASFQTAIKRVSGRRLVAASIWSIFGSFMTSCVLYLDPIEGSYTSMSPEALSFYFSLIVVLRVPFTLSPYGLKMPLRGIVENL